MRKLEEFVNEKLKVTKNSGGVNIKTTLRKFLSWFTGEPEYRINRFDLEDRNFISSDKSMSKGDITDFLYKHINDEIDVNEEPKEYRIEILTGLKDEKESKSRLYDYSFDIDGKIFSIDARIFHDNELLSHCKDYIIEKLKVSKKSANILQVELRNFITWYMYDDDEWDESELKFVEFARNTTDKYFDSSYKKLYEFITKHETDVINVSEEYKQAGIYMYSFEVDGIPFEVQASVDKESELLSAQSNILIEKLKVTKDSIKGNIKSTMKGFFLWYWGYETINDDFWDAMYTTEFSNDVLEEYFNDNINDFVDWFSKNMDDIVYFEEVKDGKENYKYTFTFDEMTFKLFAWVSPENNTCPFSKSQYIIRRLHEKLRVTKEPDRFLKKNKLKDVIFKTFNIGSWRIFEFKELFKDARKEYFNDDIGEMLEFFSHNENREVEYNIDAVEWLDDTTKMVELYFIIDGKEFKEQFIEED